MRTVALISGGKDSCYNMMQCISEGHEIVALANLRPKDKDELDSYMYQTVGHHAIDLYAEAMGLPLYRHTIQGTSSSVDMGYNPTPGDEVEDLYTMLKNIQKELHFEAVSVGAILSDYQRIRVENVCQRLGLTSLAYLWRRDQSELLKEMIDCDITAIVIKVASYGLSPKKHLGRTIKELYPQFVQLNKEFDLNVCGEGGEYETFTVDCPLFKKSIVIDSTEEVVHSNDAFAPVGYLNIKSAHLENKGVESDVPLQQSLSSYCMKRSSDIHKEILTEEEQNSDNITETMHQSGSSDMDDQACLACACRGCIRLRMKSTDKEFWVSGVAAEISEGKSIEELTKDAMERLKECIEELAGSWNMYNLCMVHLYVKDLRDFGAINAVYNKYFKDNPPSRLCVQVPMPDNVVLLIDAYGYHGDDRRTMHVQSRSHWAPAMIGPYSQSVRAGDRIYVAGQIAMVPGTLQIISGGIRSETKLSIRHIERILQAMPGKAKLSDVILSIGYVTRKEYVETAKEEWNNYLKKETDNKLENHTSLIDFVIVPKLPRNAQIEWQVYADVSQNSSEVDRVVQISDRLQSISKYIVGNGSLSCIIKIDKTDDTQYIEEKQVVKCFCDCYKDLISKSSVDLQSLPTLKIFLPVSIYKSYETIIQGLTEELPPSVIYTVIPVTMLSSNNSLLMGCH